MPPIDTSALATIFAWVWGQYGKSITDKTLKRVWEEIRWEDRALAYAKKVQRLYGTMQILGQARPVPLEGIYTAVSMFDRPTALNRYTVEEMQVEFTRRTNRYFHNFDEEKRRDGLEMVKEGENLFILGKPGAGKTTLLKYVALIGVRGKLGERVPIFIGLKQLSDSGLSVFDFVVNEFDVCDFPDAAPYLDRLLKAGKAILLFDGLDEVNVADDERRRLIADVENFTRKYEQCQRLITCRLAADDYLFQRYTYVEMADFNAVQIREFVAHWFEGGADWHERQDFFLSELEKPESEGLRELARVPLFLALLCLAFEETLKLSSRRAELYEEALDALLKKWDSSRNIRRDEAYRDLTLRRKEQMLARVAAETFDRGEYFIPRKTLTRSFEAFLARVPDAPQDVNGDIVLRAIIAQHGLFLERTRDIYSFAHQTFQEYFTARYVIENEARGTLSRLVEQYADPRYREVFLLTAAQLPEATAFFEMAFAKLATEVQERSAVVALLQRTALKAATESNGGLTAAAVRSFYLGFALVPDLDLARTLDLDLDPALARARDLARDLNLVLALALARALTFSNQLALSLDRALDLSRAVALDLGRSHYADLAREAAVVNAWLILEVVIALMELPDKDNQIMTRGLSAASELIYSAAAQSSVNLEEGPRHNVLSNLAERINYSTSDLNLSQLKALSGELQTLMGILDLVDSEIGGRDWVYLHRYIRGNILLLDCLKQAVVADREKIKNRLLLLPEV